LFLERCDQPIHVKQQLGLDNALTPKIVRSMYDIKGGGVTYINGMSNFADKNETHSDAINYDDDINI